MRSIQKSNSKHIFIILIVFLLLFLFFTGTYSYSSDKGLLSLSEPSGSYPREQTAAYAFMVDPNWSSIVGTENCITLHRGLYSLQELLLPRTLGSEQKPARKAGGIVYRIGKTLLLENLYDHFLFLTQHEVFGHGARYRELGYEDNSYHLSPIFPYGDSHGFARKGNSTLPVSNHQTLAATAAGNEANTLLAHRLRRIWLERGSIHYRESVLYTLANCNLLYYVLGTHIGLLDGSGNDINQYLSRIDPGIGIPENPDALTIERLALYSLVSLADPFLYFSIFTYVAPYLIKGRPSHPLPGISIGRFTYMPAAHVFLTPFGVEFGLKNYVFSSDRGFILSLRVGDPTFHTFGGARLDMFSILTIGSDKASSRKSRHPVVTLDGSLEGWYQPILETKENNPYPPLLLTTNGSAFGGLITVNASVMLSERAGVGIELGYKSSGFVPGEMLDAGIIIRGGLLLSM